MMIALGSYTPWTANPRLFDQIRDQIHIKRYSIRTEQIYCDWVKQFTRFHRYRHPAEMGAAEVEAFLTDLVVRRKISASMWQVERLQLADSNAPPRHVWRVSPALQGRIKPSREVGPACMKIRQYLQGNYRIDAQRSLGPVRCPLE